MSRRLLAGGISALVLAVATSPGRADEHGDRLREAVERIAPSIVTVRAVIRTEMNFMGQSQDEESREEFQAAVVDPSGLAILSESHFSSQGGGLGGMRIRGMNMQSKRSVQDMKVIVEREDKEYEAFLVATDSKLHVAFLQVEGLGDRKLPALSLADATKPAIGDQVFAVSRLGKGYDFAPFATSARVSGRISKPRTAWTLDGSLGANGLLVFTPGRQVIGVLTTVDPGTEDEEDSGMNIARIMRRMQAAIGGGMIVPASAVSGSVDQAKAKAVEMIAERAKKRAEEAEKKKAEGEKKPEDAAKSD